MNHYSDTIATAIATNDPATVALVEHFMRIEHSTFDHLPMVKFRKVAREAFNDVIDWEYSGSVGGLTLTEYCKSEGLLRPQIRGL